MVCHHSRWHTFNNPTKNNMKKYKIEVVETLKRTIDVSANSPEEARQKVMDMYYDQEIILSGDDYYETEFIAL